MPPWQLDFTSDYEAGCDMVVPFDSFTPCSGPNRNPGLEEPSPAAGVEEATTPTMREVEARERPAARVEEASPSGAGKNPVMILNELKPGLEFQTAEGGGAAAGGGGAARQFTVTVEVEGEAFEGAGASKKLAKQAVAKAVLSKIYRYNFTPLVARGGGAPGTSTEWRKVEMEQAVADQVGRLVLAKYDELMKDDVQHSKRKVIAGIVVSRDLAMEDLEVVAVSTGTKCVSGEYMSVSGAALNDCHAEIVSRRCLLALLYRELEALAMGAASTLLEEAPEGGYRLQHNLRLHLYINTAPCGDARIFSPHEAEQGDEGDRHPNRRARGQLRTKIESGEGTIPVKADQDVQTWDGVLQGGRLLTMSCSDKVARWNLLGLQGALLSCFLQPLYLHSIVLGSLFHPTHMHRAVVGRLATALNSPPAPYTLHTPRLNLLSSREVRNPCKAPNHSVNWTMGDAAVEVIDAMKGKLVDGGRPSRLCKLELFKRWQALAGAEGLRRRVEVNVAEVGAMQYSEAKLAATDFQAAKGQLFQVGGPFFSSFFLHSIHAGVQGGGPGCVGGEAHGAGRVCLRLRKDIREITCSHVTSCKNF